MKVTAEQKSMMLQFNYEEMENTKEMLDDIKTEMRAGITYTPHAIVILQQKIRMLEEERKEIENLFVRGN